MFEAAAFIIGLLIGFILCAVMYTAKHINDIEVMNKQYMDMTNLLYHTPVMYRWYSLKGKPEMHFYCPRCSGEVAPWQETCKCGNKLEWGESEDLSVNKN